MIIKVEPHYSTHVYKIKKLGGNLTYSVGDETLIRRYQLTDEVVESDPEIPEIFRMKEYTQQEIDEMWARHKGKSYDG